MERAQQDMSYFALGVMVLGGTLAGLTQTGVNTMLPAVAADFGMPVSQSQWLSTSFMLCMGVIMPTVAFLSRRFHARELYLASLLAFMLGSLVMALSPTFALMIVGRVLQGCATGIIMPLLQVVAFTRFPLRKRGTIMGVMGLAFGFAPNIGPTIGGALQDAFGWRSFFWALLAFTALLFVLAAVCVSKSPRHSEETLHVDNLSLALSTIGFGGLLLGVTNASSAGLASASCLVPLIVGALVVAAFVRRQLSLERPFLDMRVFAYRDMTAGTVAICLLFASFIGMALAIPLELQALHGYSALLAGMAMLPGTVTALVMNPISGIVLDRFGPRAICLFGSAAVVVGTGAMMNLAAMDSLFWVMLWQGVRQVGISSLIVPLTTWSVSALPARLSPDGSSVTNAFRQIAAALATSVTVLLMAGGGASGAVSAAGTNHAAWFSIAAAVAMAAICVGFVKSKAAQR